MIPIFKPYMPKNITNDLEEILYSGKLSYGSIGKEFEKKLSNFIGNDNLISVSSYDKALLIVLSTLGLRPGDEIIASPMSCLASNQPFVIKNLNIRWADVNPSNGSLLVEDVKSKINSKTKAIFHNHYCGYLGDIKEINNLGKQYGIPVIDDCVESFGSELDGNKAGNLGTDITVFSFQTVRLPNTIDGGAIVFNDKKMLEKAKKIRDYGINRSNFRDQLNEINPKCDIKLEGYGALMSEVNSYIGVKQMEDLEFLLNKQRENANRWKSRIDEMKNIISIPINKNLNPNFWVYGIISKNKYETISHFRDLGFYATSVHINNNIYSVFKNNVKLDGVSEFIDRFVAIPSGWWVNYKNI